MSYTAACYADMLETTDTYVYALTDIGEVDILRADSIDTEWVRFINLGGKIAPSTAPMLTSIDPVSAVIGGEDVTLTCTGTGFTDGSVIVFNGGEELTEFVSETELTTIVKPSLAGAAVTVPVLVKTGPWQTPSQDFSFTEAAEDEAGKTRRR